MTATLRGTRPLTSVANQDEIRSEHGQFWVVDMGSLNGTYVNREAVESAVLRNGDEIQIGKFRLVFLSGPTTDLR